MKIIPLISIDNRQQVHEMLKRNIKKIPIKNNAEFKGKTREITNYKKTL